MSFFFNEIKRNGRTSAPLPHPFLNNLFRNASMRSGIYKQQIKTKYVISILFQGIHWVTLNEWSFN